jgi:small subunit ribosomal protein S16
MPVKIRLARHGKKDYAFYHIVVADSRAPRDGRFIERIGSYNPNTNPATIELKFEKALDWMFKGAQPTDTVRSILSKKGVLMKKHLLEGVKKGAFTAEVAEEKFNAWAADKSNKTTAELNQLTQAKNDAKRARLAEEAKQKEAKAAKLAEKLAAAAAAAAPEAAAEETTEEAAESTEA